MFGLVGSENMYRKFDRNCKDINIINKHLEDPCEASLGEHEKGPITSDNVALGANKNLQPTISNIHRKHESLRAGKLEQI